MPDVPAVRRPGRCRLLLSSSIAAAAVAFAAGPVRGQAFQGTPTVSSGMVGFSRETPGRETITVDSKTAVINWAPSDTRTGAGPIDFLPSGNVATFQNGADVSGYVAINRILPTDTTRPVALNGTINSLVNGAQGGTVWFYSPGGLMIGASATFNIGSLVLTANDPIFDANGSPFATDGSTTFTAASNSISGVVIASGAKIDASQPNSYVALIAPRVAQGGTVRINGQAAYIAGESVKANFHNGANLFDIEVDTGSYVDPSEPSNLFVLAHTGTTTGPASTGAGDPHAIYMVTQSKNMLVNALLQVNGQFGFDTPTSASIENGSIVLSAGTQIVAGALSSTVFGIDGKLTPASNFTLTGSGTVTSNVAGSARQRFDLLTSGASRLEFTGDVDVQTIAYPGAVINVATSGTSSLAVDGDLSLTASTPYSLNSAGNVIIAPGGTTQVSVGSGTSLVVGGSLQLSANGSSLSGGKAIGGTASIVVGTGGSLKAGYTTLSASATGVSGSVTAAAETAAGNAQGGTVSFQNAGSATFTSGLTMLADATGGAGATASSPAGSATGGTVTISDTGSLSVAGATQLSATGTAGAGVSASGVGGKISANTSGNFVAQSARAATIAVKAGGDISLTDPAATTSLNLSAGGSISTGDVSVSGTAMFAAGTSGTIQAGAITAGSDVDLTAGGTIKTGDISLLASAGGAVVATTEHDIAIGDVNNASVSLEASGNVTFGNLTTSTNSETNIYADGSITGGNVRAAELEIAGKGKVKLGNLTVFYTGDPDHNDGLAVLGVNDVSIGDVNSINRAELYSVNGNLKAGAVTAPELGIAMAGGSISLASLTTKGIAYVAGFKTTKTGPFFDYDYAGQSLIKIHNANLYAPNGATNNKADATAQARLALLTPAASGGAIQVGALTASMLIAASNTQVSVSSPGSLLAHYVTAPIVTLTAAGLLSVDGMVDGDNIALTSGDIAITSTGSVGETDTSQLTLNAGSSDVRLGGSSAGAGYTLDSAEITRITAKHATVIASAGSASGILPTVTLGTMTLDGSQSADGSASVEIDTPGTVNVIGKVDYVDAAAGDIFRIDAGTAITVATPGGGIAMTGSGKALGGNLQLLSGRIVVASAAAGVALAQDGSVAARNATLAKNDGPANPAGYLQANTIALSASKAIYVQNSGTNLSQGGLTAGSGGLSITSLASFNSEAPAALPEVIVYGRQQTSNGSFLSGGGLVPVTRFLIGNTATTTPSQVVAAGSTINGCLIFGGGPCNSAPGNLSATVTQISDVVQDVVSKSSNAASTTGLVASADAPTALIDVAPLTIVGDIDPPATGVGNEAFWEDTLGIGHPGQP